MKSAEQTLAAGTYWFSGAYGGANAFAGSIVKTSANERLRVLGTVQGASTQSDGSFTIQVFDRTVRVEPTMILNRVESVDESAESDVECEQEGEHEGENEGC